MLEHDYSLDCDSIEVKGKQGRDEKETLTMMLMNAQSFSEVLGQRALIEHSRLSQPRDLGDYNITERPGGGKGVQGEPANSTLEVETVKGGMMNESQASRSSTPPPSHDFNKYNFLPHVLNLLNLIQSDADTSAVSSEVSTRSTSQLT